MKKVLAIFKNIILVILAVIVAIAMISCFFISFDFFTSDADLFLYRVAGFLFLFIIEIGLLLEIDFLKLRKKTPLIRSTSLFKHLLFWFVLLVVGAITFACVYGMISEDFKSGIASVETSVATTSPTTFTSTVTTPTIVTTPATNIDNTESVQPDFEITSENMENVTTTQIAAPGEVTTVVEDIITETVTEPSILLVIDIATSEVATEETIHSTQNDEPVTKEAPLTFVFSDAEFTVGACTIVLSKIEFMRDRSSYNNVIRVHATVKNNSSQETYLSAKKSGTAIIGKYYGSNGEEKIGWNGNFKWKVDPDIKTDSGWTLSPNQERDIFISGVYFCKETLMYSDTPMIDLYFTNENETLTIPIN